MSTVYGGGGYLPAPQINFNWISEAWASFRAQMGTWIGALLLYFVVLLVIGVPMAFVTGYAGAIQATIAAQTAGVPPISPFAHLGSYFIFGVVVQLANSILLGGLYRMALRQARGETIQATDVFSAFDVAGPLLVVGLLTQIIAGIGSYLCVLPGLIAAGLLMFAPLLVVDKKLGPFQAMSESFSMLKSQWLMAALFYFVAALVGGIGIIVFGIGALFTYPLLFISVTLGYLAFTGQLTPPTQDYGTAQPGVWPPPPGSMPPSV